MSFLPVKQQGLAAASGTTPFDFLFLGFSFFLMASAVMLIALLFQLGVEQRMRELGTLAAAGIDRRQISRLLGREGLVVAAIGAAIGIAAGIGYAWLMIAGLRTWWVDAIGTPFLQLHVTPRSLLFGWIIGVAISWLAIWWSIRRLARMPVNRLLSGIPTGNQRGSAERTSGGSIWPTVRGALALLIFANLMFVLFGPSVRSEIVAGLFFGTGALVLSLLLGEIHRRLRDSADASPQRGMSMAGLSTRNISRSSGRSTLTIGLVSAASFLIIAISAFRLETSDKGTGGFDWMATSDQPIHHDLNTPEGQLELGFSDEGSEQLATMRVFSLRVADGEDASCLNLYRPAQPRVLGVPDALIERGGFEWSAESGSNRLASSTPWELLRADLGQDGADRQIVPVVLDASTAAYSLHLKGVGSNLTIRDADNRPITLEVVGLLKNSVLQGNLLISEQNFLRLFPDIGGYRYFLIEGRDKQIAGRPRAVRIGRAARRKLSMRRGSSGKTWRSY